MDKSKLPRWWWIAAGAIVLLTIFGLRWQLERNRQRQLSSAGVAVEEARNSARTKIDTATQSNNRGRNAGLTADNAARSSDQRSTSVVLRARLIDAAVAAREHNLTAYIAAAQIDPSDLAEQNLRASRGGTGAGAADVLELANVGTWTTASLQLEGTSQDVIAVSQELSLAPVYKIAAYDYAAERLYSKSLRHSEAMQSFPEVHSVPATGLAIRLLNSQNVGSALQARLERNPSDDPAMAAAASERLHFIRLFKPDLVDALLEQDPVLLATSETTALAPLPDDPTISLMLATASRMETGPLTLALTPGVVRQVDIDCSKLFDESDILGTELRAQVLLEPNDEPLSAALVSRQKAETSVEQKISGPDGRVNFLGIPVSMPTNFRVETTATDSRGRLLAPRTHFTFQPEGTTSTGSEVTWRVRPFAWLVFQKPASVPEAVRRPYPVYLLQIRDAQAGTWRNVPLDQFYETADEIAIAVESDGEFRLGVAHSPVEVYYTSSAQPKPGQDVVVRPTDSALARTVDIKLSLADGQAYNDQILVSGVHGLPPLRVEANGSVQIATTESEMEIAAPGLAPVRVQTDAAAAGSLSIMLQKP